MKLHRMFIMFSIVFLLASTTVAAAGDFGWISDFNVRAEADASGFRAQLGARFNLGAAQVTAVLGNVERPADAYMVLRLGEMAHRPPEYVVERYKANRGRGWGVLAKSLGIKPGSKEFHALKRGSDLYGGKGKDRAGGKGKDKHENKDKGRGKGKGKGRYKERD